MGVKDIFDSNRHAVQWTAARFGVPCASLRQHKIAINMSPRPQCWVAVANSSKTILYESNGCRLAAAEAGSHLGSGQQIEPGSAVGMLMRHLQSFLCLPLR
jgi:hypothetical protein